MEWKDEYSVGILEIDDQHKRLLRRFSAIEESIVQGKDWASIHFAIVDLKDAAARHFSFEETLMRLYGYARLDAHEKSHRNLLRKLQEIEHDSLKNSAKHDMLGFLRNWLAMHIQRSDRDYAGHILAGAPIVRSAAARRPAEAAFFAGQAV